MILPLDANDKDRLKRLSQQKDTIFSLKKLFINAACERPASNEVNYLAAQKIALTMLYDVFHDLEVIQPDSTVGTTRENLF